MVSNTDKGLLYKIGEYEGYHFTDRYRVGYS